MLVERISRVFVTSIHNLFRAHSSCCSADINTDTITLLTALARQSSIDVEKLNMTKSGPTMLCDYLPRRHADEKIHELLIFHITNGPCWSPGLYNLILSIESKKEDYQELESASSISSHADHFTTCREFKSNVKLYSRLLTVCWTVEQCLKTAKQIQIESLLTNS